MQGRKPKDVRYRSKHREQRIAYNRKYRQEHAAEIRAHRRTPTGRYVQLKSEAKRRHISVALTFAEYRAIMHDPKCVYCGMSISDAGHGVDRKNSHLGYSLENCVPCCTKCNRMRGQDVITYEQMFFVAALLNTLGRGDTHGWQKA
jgi:5-methylcytosine-specific restriction endonuclease McrA